MYFFNPNVLSYSAQKQSEKLKKVKSQALNPNPLMSVKPSLFSRE